MRPREPGPICAEPNGPAGKGILEGKGSRLLYDCADVNGIIQMLAECWLPALSRPVGRGAAKTRRGIGAAAKPNVRDDSHRNETRRGVVGKRNPAAGPRAG